MLKTVSLQDLPLPTSEERQSTHLCLKLTTHAQLTPPWVGLRLHGPSGLCEQLFKAERFPPPFPTGILGQGQEGPAAEAVRSPGPSAGRFLFLSSITLSINKLRQQLD